MKTFLRECIKPAFVDMYKSADTLEVFREQLMVNMDEETLANMKPIPRMGTLVLEDVLESEFFFS